MIIFDTNQLRGLPLTGSLAAMLVAIATDAGQTLAISKVTEDEYRSARRREYQQRLDNVLSSIKSLRKLTPGWQPPELGFPPVESLVERDLSRVTEIFTVLPLDGDDAIEALQREADRKLPASQDAEPGTGGRDAAIWLTTRRQSTTDGKPVYLVSADSKAFGKRSLHSDLATEAAANSAEVILCPSVADLLDQFATKDSTNIDVAALLESTELADSVRQLLGASSFLEAAAVVPEGESAFESDGVHDLSLRDAADIQAYEVRGETWIAVRGTWTGRRNMIRKLAGGSVVEDWEVDLDQRISLLVRVSDGQIRGADVVSLGSPKAEVKKKSVTVHLGTAHEIDTAFPVTIERVELG
ncbi:PIN domain-containing protein [Kribbella sp. CA-247076]|uniref:PIN domain-containing protein n=1 Tax=Kribbella sp. CA-247076 TaxID=3239941 RepID=UPI003D8E796E